MRLVMGRGGRYTPGMREYIVASLILLFLPSVSAQVVPAGWQIVKDSKNACQIAVPPDWSPYGENTGAATFHDSTTAIAVVTSQPAQDFSPLTASLQRVLDIGKEKMFENTAKRIFYQDKTSRNPEETNAYSFSVPGKTGTCSGHLTFLPSVTEDVARKIALSLGPVAPPHAGTL
jgi:hypothetical protein